MEKQPFTEAGVQDKFVELYALNDTELRTEAVAAKDDLRTWVSDHFTLDTDQAGFLANLSDDWISAAGGQLFVAMQYRLNVTIVIDTPPDPAISPTLQGKWINYHEVPIFTDPGGPGSSATGSLKFKVSYNG